MTSGEPVPAPLDASAPSSSAWTAVRKSAAAAHGGQDFATTSDECGGSRNHIVEFEETTAAGTPTTSSCHVPEAVPAATAGIGRLSGGEGHWQRPRRLGLESPGGPGPAQPRQVSTVGATANAANHPLPPTAAPGPVANSSSQLSSASRQAGSLARGTSISTLTRAPSLSVSRRLRVPSRRDRGDLPGWGPGHHHASRTSALVKVRGQLGCIATPRTVTMTMTVTVTVTALVRIIMCFIGVQDQASSESRNLVVVLELESRDVG